MDEPPEGSFPGNIITGDHLDCSWRNGGTVSGVDFRGPLSDEHTLRTEMMRLNSRVAVITGAVSGIGEATALLFGDEGAKVVVADLDAEGRRKTAAQVRER